MTAHTELEVDGRFEHGRIVLNAPAALPEGAQLHLRITIATPKPKRQLPADFFKRFAGAIDDPTFVRPPQGEYEVREPLP